MQRQLTLAVLLSVLCISCGGPRVVIHDQGSSSMLPSTSEESNDVSGIQTSHTTKPDQPDAYVIVSSLPELEGGNSALRKKIAYPDEAIRNNIEGIVRVQFKNDGQGETSDFIVKEEIGYGCDEAVIRAIRDSEFTPRRGPGGSTVNFLWEVIAEFRL